MVKSQLKNYMVNNKDKNVEKYERALKKAN